MVPFISDSVLPSAAAAAKTRLPPHELQLDFQDFPLHSWSDGKNSTFDRRPLAVACSTFGLHHQSSPMNYCSRRREGGGGVCSGHGKCGMNICIRDWSYFRLTTKRGFTATCGTSSGIGAGAMGHPLFSACSWKAARAQLQVVVRRVSLALIDAASNNLVA